MSKLAYTLLIVSLFFSSCNNALDLYVAPEGNNNNAGTIDAPFASLHRAQEECRKNRKNSITVYLREGTYYLSEPVVFTTADSRTKKSSVCIKAYPNEKVIISGGTQVNNLTWEVYQGSIMQAKVDDKIIFDQLFINGEQQIMARYPNFDINASHYNGTSADAIDESRTNNWKNPVGGYVHALHRSEWGGYHWIITGKDSVGKVTLDGGFQNNRPMGMHAKHRFVENIFEELDSSKEWFLDKEERKLFYFPSENTNLQTATIISPQLKELFIFYGDKENPVKHISIDGLEIAHTVRTFMETREPLLRSDWAIYRGGAVLMENTEYCAIKNCYFNTVGGNAIFFSNYNRHNEVSGCHIANAGAGGICFVGDPKAVKSPLFKYGGTNEIKDIDMTPGPLTDNFPAKCVVYNNLMHNLGRVEKQIAGVQISMAQNITVSHNTIYDVPRAGINISEGTWGGHNIEYNDVFNTVLETGDHGAFNSWGRDRFWDYRSDTMHKRAADMPELILLDAVETTHIYNNRFRCDHGWDIDLDDGSGNYHISQNVCLNGGLKLREGFFRTVENNVIINNSFHPHVWFANSEDIFTRNIVMAPYFPIQVNYWGKEIDYNVFPNKNSLEKTQKNGTDKHSVAGDVEFINPESGDYRVKETSIALKTGFKNFDMDNFGVVSPELKAKAKKVPLPVISPFVYSNENIQEYMGITVKDVTTLGDQSAAGLSDISGVWVLKISDNKISSVLKPNDVIRAINGQKINNIQDLKKILPEVENSFSITVSRNQSEEIILYNK